jgi:glycosyltransferase 2 family protein
LSTVPATRHPDREYVLPATGIRRASDLSKPGVASGNSLRLRFLSVVLALVGVGLATGAPILLSDHLVFAELRAISVRVFLLLAASALVSVGAKACKLQILQAMLGVRLRFVRTFAITLVSDFAFLASPLGVAGYGTNIALLRRSGASWACATAVVGADQALDLMFFAVLVPVTAWLALRQISEVLPQVDTLVQCIVLLGTVFVACAVWACRRQLGAMLDVASRSIRWLEPRRARFGEFRRNLQRQIGLLKTARRRHVFALLLLTALQWLLRYGALWFALLELSHRLPFALVMLVQAIVLHAALWTGVPAGGGGGDLALAVSFSPWIPRAVMATALVLWRFATLYCPLALGAVGFGMLGPRRNRA